MKKKVFVIGIVVLICVCFILFSIHRKDEFVKTGIVSVNGEVISNLDVNISVNHAEIPLIRILEQCGFQILWQTEDVVELTYGTKKYEMNLQEKSLVECGNSTNLLLMLPGSTEYCCRQTDGDLIIDTNTFTWFMIEAGVKVEVIVNYDNAEVIIEILSMSF